MSLTYLRAKDPATRQLHAEVIEAAERRPGALYPVAVVHADPVRYVPVTYQGVMHEVAELLGE